MLLLPATGQGLAPLLTLWEWLWRLGGNQLLKALSRLQLCSTVSTLYVASTTLHSAVVEEMSSSPQSMVNPDRREEAFIDLRCMWLLHRLMSKTKFVLVKTSSLLSMFGSTKLGGGSP